MPKPISLPATLLVVDDTPANLQVLAECLSGAGHQVLAAEDGPSAIDLAIRAAPDLILLDVMMPGIDGYETCRRLKTFPETRDIPVLFMTARSDVEAKVRGFQAGAVDYITKPYQEEEVLARVTTHLTLARQKRDLERMLEERSRFMKIAAHDLRNPLTAIVAWAEFGEMSAGDPEVPDMFRKIGLAALQMNEIINDFLALQILKIQAASAAKTEWDLRALLAQVIDQLAPAAERKSTTLTLQAPEGPAPARGHWAHMHQILTNYLSNGVKYSPPGSRVTARLCRKPNAWRVEVADQGPGIPPEERHKIFTEFPRISTRPTGGETSTGLGLAIVKNLAESQGGAVGVEFPAQGGSVFWVDIPALPA